MKTTTSQLTDYGIYIDHTHCIMVALQEGNKSVTREIKSNLVTHERFAGEGSNKTRSVDHTGNSQKQHQNKLNNEFTKFCKSIAIQIHNPNRILIMGPSDAKFELQKEIRKIKNLQGVYEELKTTDKMSKSEVTRFTEMNFAVRSASENL